MAHSESSQEGLLGLQGKEEDKRNQCQAVSTTEGVSAAPVPLVCPREAVACPWECKLRATRFCCTWEASVRTANIHIYYVPRTLPSTLQMAVAAPRRPPPSGPQAVRQCGASGPYYKRYCNFSPTPFFWVAALGEAAALLDTQAAHREPLNHLRP